MAKSLSRRGFLGMLAGAAAVAIVPLESKRGCLFGVNALDHEQQAYPVTTPCPSTFGAVVAHAKAQKMGKFPKKKPKKRRNRAPRPSTRHHQRKQR